jgi:hypothetical protein
MKKTDVFVETVSIISKNYSEDVNAVTVFQDTTRETAESKSKCVEYN